MDEEFVPVKEDLPCPSPKYTRVSTDIDVLLKDGTIVEDCFCQTELGEFYDRNGRKLRNVKGWRTHEDTV